MLYGVCIVLTLPGYVSVAHGGSQKIQKEGQKKIGENAASLQTHNTSSLWRLHNTTRKMVGFNFFNKIQEKRGHAPLGLPLNSPMLQDIVSHSVCLERS